MFVLSSESRIDVYDLNIRDVTTEVQPRATTVVGSQTFTGLSYHANGNIIAGNQRMLQV